MIVSKTKEINGEIFWAWIAPDGVVQLSTLAPDAVTSTALVMMLHKKGIGRSVHEMKLKGFKLEPVVLTIKNGHNIAENSQKTKGE